VPAYWPRSRAGTGGAVNAISKAAPVICNGGFQRATGLGRELQVNASRARCGAWPPEEIQLLISILLQHHLTVRG